METKDILQLTEVDFEKAWEEWGDVNPHVPVARRTARFFFFAGTQAGVAATKKLYEATFTNLQNSLWKDR